MGLFTYALTGGGLILIGAWEVFISSYATLHSSSSSSSSQPLSPPYNTTPTSIIKTRKNPFLLSVRFIAVSLFSSIFILDSLLSLYDALTNKDQVGIALQLQIIAILSLSLLYSVFGLLSLFTNFLPIPSSLLDLIALFLFGQEFLFFYLQRKNPNGLENRYSDLLLVPIFECILMTILELGGYNSNLPNLARGVGLILQGTWFIQMGFSLCTNVIAQGCSLVEKSRGNFSVMCKGHMAEHRSKAIVTLQFNGHLALLVIFIVGFYGIVAYKYDLHSDYMNYKPLTAEMQQIDHAQYTLDSDEETSVEENGSKS